jgi:hypothetical protein
MLKLHAHLRFYFLLLVFIPLSAVIAKGEELQKKYWPNAVIPMNDGSIKSLIKIREEAYSDPYLYKLHTRAHNMLVRTQLEREVADVLDTDPNAIAIRNEVLDKLVQSIYLARMQHMS